jgi:hypothetical protein
MGRGLPRSDQTQSGICIAVVEIQFRSSQRLSLAGTKGPSAALVDEFLKNNINPDIQDSAEARRPFRLTGMI